MTSLRTPIGDLKRTSSIPRAPVSEPDPTATNRRLLDAAEDMLATRCAGMDQPYQQPVAKKHRPAPRVLCIDDDPDVSDAIARRLSRYDVHLIRAFHGMHGYAEALAHKPDVIVLDLVMPSGDGATILECLRRNQATAAIPVVVLTGMRDRRLRHKLLSLGANRFLRKPILLDELTDELRRFVELHEREPVVD